jgi:hypothetical protein
MEIAFDLGGRQAVFRRNGMTGRTAIIVDGETVTLASPYSPFTQFEVSTHKTWRRRIGDHDVEVVKDRPLLVGGMRKNSYRIVVDGHEVAAATGR